MWITDWRINWRRLSIWILPEYNQLCITSLPIIIHQARYHFVTRKHRNGPNDWYVTSKLIVYINYMMYDSYIRVWFLTLSSETLKYHASILECLSWKARSLLVQFDWTNSFLWRINQRSQSDWFKSGRVFQETHSKIEAWHSNVLEPKNQTLQ